MALLRGVQAVPGKAQLRQIAAEANPPASAPSVPFRRVLSIGEDWRGGVIASAETPF